MISRRNFLIIFIVMGIMFVLFQFSQVMKDSGNYYNTNKYADLDIVENDSWVQNKNVVGEDNWKYDDGKYILFLGQEDSNIGNVVMQWANYSKRDIAICDDIKDFSSDKYGVPEFLIADSTTVNFDSDSDKLIELTNDGVSIVFCGLPSVDYLEKHDTLRHFLGIDYIEEKNVHVEGIKLFSGFLLGGEVIYKPQKEEEVKRQDLQLDVPWYITTGATKTYMVGILDDYFGDSSSGNDEYPALIWRHSLQNAQVFCIYDDFMSDTSGIGILSAMIYELSKYQIYPVVNAQNTLVIDYPLMANENDEKIQDIYSRSLDEFQINVVWPSLVSLSEKNQIKYTCFMTPKYNYSDTSTPLYDNYNSLLQMYNEYDTELGMSLEHAEGISLLNKLAADNSYYDGLETKYEFTSAFLDIKDAPELDEAVKNRYVSRVRTIACDQDSNIPILGYITDDITLQSLTSNTKNFTYSRDLMLKSIETALGYDNAKLDLSDVAWPESEEDQWENIYDDMASSLSTYWSKFRTFDRTTLTESDLRVRTFLNLSATSDRKDDTVTLHVIGTKGNTCWFILRTHDEKIVNIEGASYKRIEKDAYLLEIQDNEVVISLESTN